ELEAALAKDLANCGAQAQKIQEESQKGLQMAIDRVEKVAAVKREAQEKLAEAARLREEARKFAEELLKELESLVDEAEKAVKTLKDKAEPLKDAADMSMKLVEKTAKVVEEKGDIARAKMKAAADFVKENSAKIKLPPKLPANPGAIDTGAALAKAVTRNSVCTKECNEALAFAKTTVAKMGKKAEAKKKMDVLNTSFAKFDKDGDGLLSKPEVPSRGWDVWCCGVAEFPDCLLDATTTRLPAERHRPAAPRAAGGTARAAETEEHGRGIRPCRGHHGWPAAHETLGRLGEGAEPQGGCVRRRHAQLDAALICGLAAQRLLPAIGRFQEEPGPLTEDAKA
ncbi:unnamed protein product, partial [Prorocentrum cordatum]